MVYRDATGATSHQGSGSPGAAEPSYRTGREGAVNALSDVRQEALSLLTGQGDSLAIAGALLTDILGPVASPRGSVRRWRPVVEEAQAAGSAPRYRPPGQPDPAPGVPVLAVPLREVF